MIRSRLAVVALAALGACVAACNVHTNQPDLDGQDVRVTFVHTTDIHSRLLPYPMKVAQTDKNLGLADENGPFGGIARIAHIARMLRGRADRSLHVDTGDSFQGAPIFNVFQGEVEMRALSLMGVDVMAIGNHEFDSGEPNVADKIQRFAAFPVLAANYYLSAPLYPVSPPLADLIKSYEIFNLKGLRVGIIGLGNTSSMTSLVEAPNSLGITPMENAEVTQFNIEMLRPQVDVIVIASHLGLTEDQALIGCTSGADLVLGGHHHIVLDPPKVLQDGQECYYEVATRYLRTACAKAGGELWQGTGGGRPAAADVARACDGLLPDIHRLLSTVPEVAGRVLPSLDEGTARTACTAALDQEMPVPAAIGALPPAERAAAVRQLVDDFAEGACYPLPRNAGYLPPPARNVPLAHSGAFAKYVGHFDAVFRQKGPCADGVDNDRDGLVDEADPGCVDGLDGSEARDGRQPGTDWEMSSFQYEVIPVDRRIPDDRLTAEMLEPYADILKQVVPLDQILGYAPVDAARFGSTGGDSPLGNLVAAAMRGRKGVETDFAVTNSLGIRSDVYAGPVTVDDLYNVFPFENSITTMFLSGREVVELFDYVARRSGSRGCQAQAQVAGVTAVLQCGRCDLERRPKAWTATSADAEGCALEIKINGQDVSLDDQYSVAVNDYIAKGGSGFMMLKRNTTQINTGIPQRDALMDVLRAGKPCGALKACTHDGVGDGGCDEGYACSCPERASWNGASCDRSDTCAAGICVLANCASEVKGRYWTNDCGALDAEGAAGAQCRCLQEQRAWGACGQVACVDKTNGIAEDGRLQLLPP
jgi:2',3'-cyclic-nucleotide 2'-phosphodiesterase (5'-nucleotidase family)